MSTLTAAISDDD